MKCNCGEIMFSTTNRIKSWKQLLEEVFKNEKELRKINEEFFDWYKGHLREMKNFDESFLKIVEHLHITFCK